MAPFCDTPLQSVGVALVAGALASGIGLATGSLVAVLLVAVAASVAGELLAHEYVGDDQYETAKRRVMRGLRARL